MLFSHNFVQPASNWFTSWLIITDGESLKLCRMFVSRGLLKSSGGLPALLPLHTGGRLHHQHPRQRLRLGEGADEDCPVSWRPGLASRAEWTGLDLVTPLQLGHHLGVGKAGAGSLTSLYIHVDGEQRERVDWGGDTAFSGPMITTGNYKRWDESDFIR